MVSAGGALAIPRNRGCRIIESEEKSEANGAVARGNEEEGEVLAIQFIRFARGQCAWGLIILATERLDYVQLSGGQ